ncbi:MAG: Gfo/Idh/MocA family protein [Verrucomicrobiales bacterium]
MTDRILTARTNPTVNTNRRRFVFSASAALGASLLGPAFPVRAQATGSNGALRVGIIGCGSKGTHAIKKMLGQPNVNIAAVCDPDTTAMEKHQKMCTDAGKAKPQAIRDFRECCASANVDAVIISTPNHTHTLLAMTAIAAGKHVYVEKPVSHNIREGRLLAEAAAKRPNLIVQHGMQRRSDTGWHEIMDWVKAGNLGKIKTSLGLNFKPRKSIGKTNGPVQPPASVDYNLWCGPRETKPLHRKQFHYDWHWQWDYGNGDIGNQGPHQLDVARWALDQMKLPSAVMSVGGRFGYEDDGETPNTQFALFDYKPAPLLFDNRGLPRKNMDWAIGEPRMHGVSIANIIECEGGLIAESRALDANGKTIKKFAVTDGEGHMENWIKAIGAGKLTRPDHGVLDGHLSASLAHLANISYRLGKSANPDEIRERLQGDKRALELNEAFLEHLVANGLDPAKSPIRCGVLLSFDPDKEVFTGEFADEANALVAGTYREEFKLPVIT